MPDRNQVPLNVRVTPKKKEEWKTSIDNDETLAGVVRRAVDRELNNEYVHVDAADYLDGGDDIDFSEVTTDLDSLSGQVEALQSELDDALTPGSMPPEDQLSEVAMQALAHIPRYSDLSDDVRREIGERDMDRLRGVKISIEGRQTRVDGSAQAIAFKMDGDESELIVRQALIYLENRTTENVRSTIADGTRNWVRGV
ncbi:hypothetical protein M0R88_02885 [Halorussus gelatinilyticus]|uniref:Uncharacterized protein n=1 Tax=Halorussus gelatinilyticus TaxID=2937524 RepID=A0A8U0ILG1_9EURY|nr:hypothetical protein [Halorussus gelatinilyticus]UPW01054.1 hypothetical protein M0R88_02885 [Halorussus gelatinilyticus]